MICLGACLLGSQAHAIAISDATIQNSTGGLDSSIATALGQGKIKNANINVLPGLFAGEAWTLLDRTNKPSKPFSNVNFLLAADQGQRSGTWGVSWDGFDFPAYMDYVLVLKSGRQWGAYLFESASLLGDPQEVAGTFAISWLNKKGKVMKLRHASLFGRTGSTPTGFDDSSIDSTGTSVAGTGSGTGTTGVHTDGTATEADTSDDPTGTSGHQAGGPGSQADASLDPDPNSVPIPGTVALLALGLGLGLRQLRQTS